VLALGLYFSDAELQVLSEKIVIAYPQTIAWHPCIDCISPIGKGIMHTLKGSGWREQLRHCSLLLVF
jgi:hypothetical protein